MQLNSLRHTRCTNSVASSLTLTAPQAQPCCWHVTQPHTSAAGLTHRHAPSQQQLHTCAPPAASLNTRKCVCAAASSSSSSSSSNDWQAASNSGDASSNGTSQTGGDPPSSTPPQSPEPSTRSSSSSYSNGMPPPPWGGAQLGPRPIQAPAPQPAPPDQFAAFKAFQQLAALQGGLSQGRTRGQARPPGGQGSNTTQGYRGRAADTRAASTAASSMTASGWRVRGPSMQPVNGEVLSAKDQLAMFRRNAAPALRRGWYANSSMTVEQLHAQILGRCTSKCPGPAPLFQLLSLSECAEHMRLALDACVAVRAAQARNMNLRPIGGPRLAMAFTRACMRCDAPDVLSSALLRSNEAGLVLSYGGVHEALQHWGTTHELHKVEQVLVSMPQGGLPYTTPTAYVAIRAAVNAGRQETAEKLAAMFKAADVRLHPTTLRLLELGRQRANARAEAVAAIVNTPGQPSSNGA